MEPNTPSVLLLLLYEFAFHLFSVSIGPLSDHCLALTLTEWLTHPYCWDLIVPSLSFEDTISKLVKEEKYNEIGKSSISRIRSEMTKNHWVCWLESLIQIHTDIHKAAKFEPNNTHPLFLLLSFTFSFNIFLTRMIFGDHFFITILPPFLLKANLCADATLSLLYHYFAI